MLEIKKDVAYERPLPELDTTTEAYWQAASNGELLIQRCPACQHRQFYPRAICTQCGESPEWENASGRGVVHTFTVIRQFHLKPFRDELPYVVAMIELEEGVRMMGNITDCDIETVEIGMEVEAYIVEAEEGVGIPFWRPVTK